MRPLLLSVLACSVWAADVKIVRDRWGVPHIEGKTSVDTVYGLMYAQAEDNFWQLEEDYIRITGRAAEVYGEDALASDVLGRMFEITRQAQAEYAGSSANTKALADAFAAGVNRYLETHPEVKPRLLTRFEPWFLFALERSVPAGPARAAGFRVADFTVPGPNPPPSSASLSFVYDGVRDGSNMWAVSPARSASGKALLMINPHVGFFGGGQRYEAHLRSKDGLNVAGFAILGTPYIRTGHNERLGWSHTNNNALITAAYMERFDDPRRPLAYKHGESYRQAIEWMDEVRVKTANGMEVRRFSFLKTHHGPVVSKRDGQRISIAAAGQESGEMEQRFAMARARNLREFQAALWRRKLTGSNTLYADREGNIFYLHGNAIPRRNPAFDWTKPVDGSNPATDWQGLHEIADLPQVLNPPSGWLQNCNSAPHLTTDGLDWPAGKYPEYLAPEKDNMRSRSSRRILKGKNRFSYNDWTLLATDTTVQHAVETLDELFAAFDKAGRPEKLAPAVASLRAWDRVSRIDSTPMTLYVELTRLFDSSSAAYRAKDEALIDSLGKAMASLEKTFGTWEVAWGEVNRHQRVHTSGRVEPFRDDRPSLPVPGGPGSLGTIFRFEAARGNTVKRYGVMGNTFVSVLEMGSKVKARSIVPFGQSADPASPHYFDQAALFAEGRFKEAWFDRKDVKANAKRSYKP